MLVCVKRQLQRIKRYGRITGRIEEYLGSVGKVEGERMTKVKGVGLC